jgi:hypothetical protein
MQADSVNLQAAYRAAAIAREARCALPHRRSLINTLPNFEVTIARRQVENDRDQCDARGSRGRLARAFGLHIETENIVKSGEAVVAAKAEIVSKETDRHRSSPA